jgi:hypothetical protein
LQICVCLALFSSSPIQMAGRFVRASKYRRRP